MWKIGVNSVVTKDIPDNCRRYSSKRHKTIMKEHNYSIDILKFLAAILITNSHMGILYHPYEKFATGGALGDVLFFFCSGFTLFMGKMDRFDNWYKKRITRIYPTIFAWALFSSIFFGKHLDAKEQWLIGGGWFISCIMLYYLLLYLIRKYFIKRLFLVFLVYSLFLLIWYLFEDKTTMFMYGATYFKWGHYFLFMLLGAHIGSSTKGWTVSLKKDINMLILSLILFYGLQYLAQKNIMFSNLQIVTLIPLCGITIYFYKICNADFLIRLAKSKIFGRIIGVISALTLEIYLVQTSLFTDTLNFLFPLNLVIVFVLIILVAYITKVLSRIFSQTFSESPYNWYSIFKI